MQSPQFAFDLADAEGYLVWFFIEFDFFPPDLILVKLFHLFES